MSVIEPLSAGRTPTPSGVRPNRPSSPSTTRPLLMTSAVPLPTAKVPPLGSRAVWWIDLPASQARQTLRDHLRGQRVDVGPSMLVLPRPATPFQTRDERAHRRQTWLVRFARNQRPLDDGCRLRIHGVPPVLDDLLGIPRDLPSASLGRALAATGVIGTTQRANGTLQVTYNGEPLYFYSKDAAPGDVNGQNVGGVWFVVNP